MALQEESARAVGRSENQDGGQVVWWAFNPPHPWLNDLPKYGGEVITPFLCSLVPTALNSTQWWSLPQWQEWSATTTYIYWAQICTTPWCHSCSTLIRIVRNWAPYWKMYRLDIKKCHKHLNWNACSRSLQSALPLPPQCIWPNREMWWYKNEFITKFLTFFLLRYVTAIRYDK